MERVKVNKKFAASIAAVFVAVVLALISAVAVASGSADANWGAVSKGSANATITKSSRITPVELMDRYPADWVLGPVDVNSDGTYKDENYLVDEDGNPIKQNGRNVLTNNIYNIPSEKYFNIENYVYTTVNNDLGTGKGRTLYGWKKDIWGVEYNEKEPALDQNGYIRKDRSGYVNGNSVSADDIGDAQVGIYCNFSKNSNGSIASLFGTTQRYALIIPDDITQVGNGNGAYVENKKSYYTGNNSKGNLDSTVKAEGAEQAFTDFAVFLTFTNVYNTVHFYQPVERISGVYFSDNSNLTKIADSSSDSVDSMSASNRSKQADSGKSAFARCGNMRFCILPNSLQYIGDAAFIYCTQMIDVNIPKTVYNLGKQAFQSCTALLHITIPQLATVSGKTTKYGTNVFANCSKLKDVVDLSGRYPQSSFPSTVFNYVTSSANSKLFVFAGAPQEDGTLDNGNMGFFFCLNTEETGNTAIFASQGSSTTATSAVSLARYQQGKWYALGLAGKTGEDGSTYVMPSLLSATGERRDGVTFDYIDCDGSKAKNTFPSNTVVTSYDIDQDFCSGTWCQNIVIPKAVKVIGNNAFNNSHMHHFETYATTFGYRALYSNSDAVATQRKEVGDAVGAQWWYFHQEKTGSSYTDYTMGDEAIPAISGKENTRYYIFGDKDLYDYVNGNTTRRGKFNIGASTDTLGSRIALYQIPVVANVVSEDGDVVIKNYKADFAKDYVVGPEKDYMKELFYNDIDYVDGSYKKLNGATFTGKEADKNGNYEIVFSKYLSGDFGWSYVKQPNGAWQKNVTGENSGGYCDANPGHKNYAIIESMSYTQWYADSSCTGTPLSSIFQKYSSGADSCIVYTKKIARPTINAQHYVFGDGNVGEGADEFVTFSEAIGVDNTAGNFTILLQKFVYHNESEATPTEVRHAGTYTIKVKLNAAKWGSWDEDSDTVSNIGVVVVDRREISIDKFEDLPKFVVVTPTGEDLYELYAEKETTLYHYGDGWYLAEQNNRLIGTKTVKNSYVYYSGSVININLADAKNLPYSVSLVNNYSGEMSGEYYATITLGLKNDIDYIFKVSANDTGFTNDEYGVTLYGKTTSRMSLLKSWYIVKQTNMFVDDETDVSGDTATAYAFATRGKDGSVISTWEYEDSAWDDGESAITVHTPKLMYNKSYTNADGSPNNEVARTIDPTIKIDYYPVGVSTENANNAVKIKVVGESKEALDSNPLGYYINSAMPAGTYVITIYGAAVRHKESDGTFKGYDDFTNTYTIVITEKKIDSGKRLDDEDEFDNLEAFKEAIRGQLVSAGGSAPVYKNSYPYESVAANRKLYNETLVNNKKEVLDATLNAALKAASADNNYWANLSTENQAKYYDGEVTILYNREGMGTSVYSSYSNMLANTTAAGEYTFYYSIAAKNYVTEIDAAGTDNDKRNYIFVTVIYTDIKFSDFYERYFVDSPYFQDVTFNGGEVKTSVPYSSNYKSTFSDPLGYVNAGAKYVTLTLNNPGLAKWHDDLDAYLDEYFKDSELGEEELAKEKAAIKARFEFVADNPAELRVYFNILPANNGWNVMPQMTSWSFNAFDVSRNTVAANLKFDSEIKYALIPGSAKPADKTAKEWLASVAWGIDGESGKKDGIVYFTVNTDGAVDAVIAAQLNALKPDTYYLKFFVSAVTYTYKGVEASPVTVTNVNALNDVAYNNSGNPIVAVTVSKAANSWTSTPNVMRWTFGDYNQEVNTITAEAMYPTLKPVDESGEELAGFVYTNGDNELSENAKFVVYIGTVEQFGFFAGSALTTKGTKVADELNALHAGTYVLGTSMAGSDYYTELRETRMNFTVGKATNIWDTTPRVLEWTWGAYPKDDTNIIIAVAKFNGGDGSVGSVDKPVIFSVLNDAHAKVNDTLLGFEVDASGKVSAEVSAALAALPAGTYYLRAEKEGNNDYTSIVGSDNTDVRFSVKVAVNSWDTTPSITGFTYGTFTSQSNFVAGVPTYPTENGIVYYAISKTPFGSITSKSDYDKLVGVGGNITFTTLGTSDEDKIKALDAGTYHYLAFVEASTDYGSLLYTGTFNVSQVNNVWATTPAMTSWKYEAFAESNFRLGVPLYDNSESAIVYTLKIKGGGEFTFNGSSVSSVVLDFTGSALSATMINGFKALYVGNYVIEVRQAATTNYSKLEQDVEFAVTKADNVWETKPVITGFTFGQFASVSNFVAGVSKYGTVVNYAISSSAFGDVKTKEDFDGLSGTVMIKFTVIDEGVEAQIKALGAGDYYYLAFVEPDNNYEYLTQTGTFRVSKVTNSWITQPSITGFDYGQFTTASSFVAGNPRYPSSDKVVYYAISKSEFGEINSIADYNALKSVSGNITFSSKDSVPEAAIKALSAGEYHYLAFVEPGDNYEYLTYTSMFTVYKVNNSWTEQPSITGYFYGQFNSANNFIAGVPYYPLEGKTVYYVISTSALPTTVTSIDVFKDLGVWFTSIEGNISTGAMTAKEYLNQLSVRDGVYYFAAFVEHGDNYNALYYTGSFGISKVTNSWKTQPAMASWKYEAFVESNFRLGEPTYVNAESPVTYVLKMKDGSSFKFGSESGTQFTLVFEKGDDGQNKLTSAMISAFQELAVGNYVITASQAAGTNFTEISMDIEFSVSSTDNSWKTQPVLTGFVYNQFKSYNFIAGVPKYPTENGTVYYAISTSAILSVDNLDGFKASGDIWFTKLTDNVSVSGSGMTVEQYLNQLAVRDGGYYFAAFVEGDDNYSYLFYSSPFNVSLTGNSWVDNTNPDIEGWVYGKFTYSTDDGVYTSELFKGAASQYGTVTYTVRKVNNGNADMTESGIVNVGTDELPLLLKAMEFNVLITHLNKLNAGVYRIFATSGSSANYTEVEWNKQFAVARAINEWDEDPTLSGWTYDDDVIPEPNLGSVKYESGADKTSVSGKYYYTITTPSGTSVDLNKAPFDEKPTDAGTYALVVTATSLTGNYEDLTYTLFFTISKAANNWVGNAPRGNYTWTWGDSDLDTYLANIIGAEAQNGTVAFEITDSSGKAYSVEGGINSSNIATVLENLPVDTYDLTVIVTPDSNHEGIEHDNLAYLTVNEATFVSVANPVCTDWTWGSTKDVNFTEITALGDSPTVVTRKESDNKLVKVVYLIVGDKNYDTHAELIAALEIADAGSYTVRVTVSCANYAEVTKEVSFKIREAAFTWKAMNGEEEQDSWLERVSWAWDDEWTSEKGGRDIPNLVAKDLDDAPVTLTYMVNATSYASYELMVAYLQSNERNAATYTVTVTASLKNYATDSKTIFVTVNVITTAWTTDTLAALAAIKSSGNTWEYSLREESATALPTFTVDNWKAATVEYTYMRDNLGINAPSGGYEEFITNEYLNSLVAGKYEITAFIRGDENHTELTATFTIIVNVAENEWLAPVLEESYTFEYEDWEKPDWETRKVPVPTAKFGSVSIAHGAASIPDINTWIEGLSAQDEPYVLTLTVDAKSDMYKGLTKTVKIIIKGKGSTWANQDDLNRLSGTDSHGHTFDYEEGLFANIESKIVLPKGREEEGSSTTYKVNFNGSEEPEVINGNTAVSYEELITYLKSASRTAGSYKITATFRPHDPSYATLVYTVTVVVNKVLVEWTTKLEELYSQTYGDVLVPTPAANKSFANITVKVAVEFGEECSMGNATLSEFVKTLNVGTYIITYAFVESPNYFFSEDTATMTSKLIIGRAGNAWKDVKMSEDETVTSQQWSDSGYTWTFTRGDAEIKIKELPKYDLGKLTIKLSGGSVNTTISGDISEIDSLLSRLNAVLGNDLPAGTYELKLSVEETVNYNGLNSNCYVVINKKANAWTQELERYEGSGSIAVGEDGLPVGFKMAAAETESVTSYDDVNLIIYGYVRSSVGGNPTTWYTADAFVSVLSGLSNGIYTVTARIGGTIPNSGRIIGIEDDDYDNFRNAMTEYNKNYEEKTTTCSVKLSPADNSWTTELKSEKWTYGDSVGLNEGFDVNLVMPVAEHGNENITFTLSGENVNLIVKASDHSGNALNAFNVILARIKTLTPGTYTLTADIAATDLYVTAGSTFAVYTIEYYTPTWAKKNGAQWENSSESALTGTYDNARATWHAVGNSFLPELGVYYMINAEGAFTTMLSTFITWAIDGVNVSDVIEELNKKDAGSYKVTATYAGNNGNAPIVLSITVHIDPVTLEWSEATTKALKDIEDLGDEGLHWDYGTLTSDNKLIPPFALKNWDDSAIKFTYTYNGGAPKTLGSSGTLEDYKDFIKYTALNTLDTGLYTITARVVKGTNNSEIFVTYSFSVKAITTAWSDELKGDIDAAVKQSWTYGSRGDKTLPILTLKNWADGKIEYSYTLNGGATIVFNESNTYANFVKNLDTLASGEYKIYAYVRGDVNHSELSVEFSLTVEKIQTDWTDDTKAALKTIESGLSWNHGARNDSDTQLPKFELTADSKLHWGERGYTISYSYTKNGGGAITITDYAKFITADYLNTELDFGVYIVTVTVAGDDNHTSLTATYSFTINLVTTAWTEGTTAALDKFNGVDGGVSWFYGKSSENTYALPTFALTNMTDDHIKYSYTVDGGNTQEIKDYTDWIGTDKLDTLDVGLYVVTAFVEAGDNNTYLTATYSFTVKVVELAWSGDTVSNLDKAKNLSWHYGKSSENTVALPKFTVSSEFTEWMNTNSRTITYSYTVDGSGSNGISKYDDEFVKPEYLNKLSVGSYVVTAYVQGDKNHKELYGTFNITVIIVDPVWTAATDKALKDIGEEGITWKYGKSESAASLPTFALENWDNSNIKYSYTYNGGNSTEIPNYENFGANTYLNKLDVGIYVVTAFVTADPKTNNAQSASFKFTIEAVDLAWSDTTDGQLKDAANLSWHYGKSSENTVALPRFTVSSEFTEWMTTEKRSVTYSYTVDGSSSVSIPNYEGVFVTTDNLNTLTVGSYVVTAYVQGDKNHNELYGTFNITVIIVDPAWSNDTDEALGKIGKDGVKWIYGKSGSTTPLPTFTLENWANSAIKYTYTYNGGNSQDIPSYETFRANSHLNTLDVGIYVVTAFVTADPKTNSAQSASFKFTIEAVDLAWSEGTLKALENVANLGWTYGTRTSDDDINKPLPTFSVSDEFGEWFTKWVSEGNAITYSYTVDGGNSMTIPNYTSFVTHTYINSNLNSGKYEVTVFIKGDLNHNSLTAIYKFSIDVVETEWKNAEALEDSFTWAYTDEPAVLPTLEVANWADHGKITYTVTNSGSTGWDGESADWNEYLSKHTLTFGTYTFVATLAGDVNHTAKTHTVIVSVTALSVDWAEGIENTSYNWALNTNGTEAGGYLQYITDTLSKPMLDSAKKGDATVTYRLVNNGGTTLYPSHEEDDAADWTKILDALSKQNSGTYRIVATAVAAINASSHTLPKAVTYTIVVSAQANGWADGTTFGEDGVINWTYNASNNPEIRFVPLHAAGGLQITIGGGRPVTSNEALADELKGLDVGSYTITAKVLASDEYAGIEDLVITLKIAQGEDSFGDYSKDAWNAGWTWDDVSQLGSNWQNSWLDGKNGSKLLEVPVPVNGTSVIVRVYKNFTAEGGSESESEEFTTTLYFAGVGSSKTTDLTVLKTRLRGLDANDTNDAKNYYRIEFTSSGTSNYGSATVSTNFKVMQTSNRWVDKPTISGWSYDTSVAKPSSAAKYGKNTVTYKYVAMPEDLGITKDEEITPEIEKRLEQLTWEDSTKTAKGTYILRAEVAATVNYTELVGYHIFEVGAAENGWVTLPAVVSWKWNGYDKEVNIFTGTARNGGELTFKVLRDEDGGKELTLEDDFTIPPGANLSGSGWQDLSGFNYAADGQVSDSVASWLNALNPGNYILSITVAGGGNYDDSLTGKVYFTVSQTDNAWSERPSVDGYVYNSLYDGTEVGEEQKKELENSGKVDVDSILQKGIPVYGGDDSVVYKIEGTLYGSNSKYNSDTFTTDKSGKAYDKLRAELIKLNAGTYTLYAWMLDGSTHKSPYSSDDPFTTRPFTVARAANSWTTDVSNTQISKAYSELQKMDEKAFNAMYAELETVAGNATVTYALLNSKYENIKGDLTYLQLLEEIKAQTVGEYYIRATASDTDNYLAIGATDTSLVISRNTNNVTVPESINAHWDCDEDGNNATVLDDELTVEALYGGETVTYTLEKEPYTSYEDFVAAVKKLDEGRYNVTVEIKATNDYEGFSGVVVLNVAQADNYWQPGWNPKDSLKVNGATYDDDGKAWSWKWDTAVEWARAIPHYGDIVYVEIHPKNADLSSQTISIDYGAGDNGNSSVSNINRVLSSLDVGKYTLVITAPATNKNWNELVSSIDFEITKIQNSWLNDPTIAGAKEVEGKYSWVYGTNVTFTADAKYGTVSYSYLGENNQPLKDIPTAAGKYKVVFTVDGSANYYELTETIEFTIEKNTNTAFATALSASGWIWGSYDRELNKFNGIPRTAVLDDAEVKFSVGIGTGDSFAPIKDLSRFTLDEKGLVREGSDVEKALRALTGGTSVQNNTTQYVLRIHVGETNNYNSFEDEVPFLVTGATNTWTETPSIMTWTVNNWSEDSLPKAAALYGDPEIKIVGVADGRTYFVGKYGMNNGKYELIYDAAENLLNKADAGMYDMTVTVASSEGQYNNVLTSTQRFQIFIKGVDGVSNSWEEQPNINGWDANLLGMFNLPTGKPVRGLPRFTFYVRNANDSFGEKITENTEDAIRVPAGTEFESDFYIPAKPGDYWMVATSNGNPTESGLLDTAPEWSVKFTINYRPLSFVEEPRIDTLLYLGSYDSWNPPTAKISATDSSANIKFVYVNKETGEKWENVMPNKPGDYTLTAYANAKYCQEISKSVDFTVKLTPNSWVTAPTIQSWAEDKTPSEPEARALYGNDRIQYIYMTLDGRLLSEKPTAEGKYKMIAIIELEGYERLESEEIVFEITATFDPTFVIVDTVLGSVATLFLIVVIIFAIRRYRQC